MLVRIMVIWNENLFTKVSCIDDEFSMHITIFLNIKFFEFLKRIKNDVFKNQKYVYLKYNMDRIKMVQLGLTSFDNHDNMGIT